MEYIVDEKHELSCGAVIYKYIKGELYYLVIYDTEYEFPKGHIEKGETELDTAKREIKEEVNIDVNFIDGFREEIQFELSNPKGVIKKVVYFLATYSDFIIPSVSDEVKEIKLLKYKEAYDLIKFDKVKDVLKKANIYLTNKQN